VSSDEWRTDAELREVARSAGVSAWVHAQRLGGPPDAVGLNAFESVAIASLYKLPLALTWADLAEEGELDPCGRMRLPAAGRVGGPTGIALLLDDVEMSQRDVVRQMLAVSDNAAGDAIFATIGRARIDDHLTALGFPSGMVRQGSADETRAMMRDTGSETWLEAQRLLADPDRVTTTSQYDPAYASSATAADLTRLLGMLWLRAGYGHAIIREAMAQQAWRHRIGSGFPHDDVTVFGKTGTLGALRHETAVVQFPHEHPIAIAVLTRSVRPERHQPRVDAAIGELARLAVRPLRMPAA